MKKLIILLWVIMLPVHADEGVDIVTHITSNHFGKTGYNENNSGIGIKMTDENNYSATTGVLKNSLNYWSGYLGVGKQKRINHFIQLSIYGGILIYPNKGSNDIFPVVMPMLSIGNKNSTQLDLVYIPEIENVHRALLLSLSWRIK